MPKIDPYRIPKEHYEKVSSEFFRTLKALDAEGQMEDFLREFFTESEQLMFGRRLQIAKMLLSGLPYENIQKELKVGLSTIRSVDRWLRIFPDYRRSFGELAAKRRGKKNFPFDQSVTFTSTRRKYPMHFLLFNVLLDE